MLQILQITHLPGHLARPEYECRPPCSTPQKQKVREYVSCEGYSGVEEESHCSTAGGRLVWVHVAFMLRSKFWTDTCFTKYRYG